MKAAAAKAEDTLAVDIAELRDRFPRTQDLYRETCTLLFFRHGITPTANKLYQLVRRGSMSAPTEAVHQFWQRLREQSRVRVEHAELPEELKAAAGEMVATLWQAAQIDSQKSLAQYQTESAAMVLAAKAAEAKAQADSAATVKSLGLARSQTRLQEELVGQLRGRLSEAEAANAGLEARVEELRRQVTAAHEAREALRMTHTHDLEKLVSRTELAEQRFVDMEKRALIEIDRERTTSAKLQKTLESEREAHSGVVERLRADHNAAQITIGQLREQVGALRNAVSSLEKEQNREREALAALRLRLEAAIGDGAAQRARAEQLEVELERSQLDREGSHRGSAAAHSREQTSAKALSAPREKPSAAKAGRKSRGA